MNDDRNRFPYPYDPNDPTYRDATIIFSEDVFSIWADQVPNGRAGHCYLSTGDRPTDREWPLIPTNLGDLGGLVLVHGGVLPTWTADRLLDPGQRYWLGHYVPPIVEAEGC